MAYITTIERTSADGDLATAYEAVAGARGTIANIFQIHSVAPAAMIGHLHFYRELMFGASPLTRVEREAIALSVSVANRCHY